MYSTTWTDEQLKANQEVIDSATCFAFEKIENESQSLQVYEEIKMMNAFFHTREHWTNQDIEFGSTSAAIVILLTMGRRQGLVSLEDKPIKTLKFQGPDYDTPEAERDLLYVASYRRGKSDLKDLTWSALAYLRAEDPTGDFFGFYMEAPYHYVDRKNKIIATAGNFEPDRIAPYLVEGAITRIGVVHQGTEFINGREYYSDKLVMTVLKMDISVLRAISDLLKRERHKRDEMMNKIQQEYRKMYASNNPFDYL